MAKEAVPVEVNNFVGGLNSDIGPLSPANEFSLDERNMVLNVDGSRNRRFGMDFEEGYEEINSSTFSNAAVNYFKWENAGGHVGHNILVLQIGNSVRFFDLSARPISAGLFPVSFSSDNGSDKKFSFASVNGLLVIAYDNPTVRVYDYDGQEIILRYSNSRIKIRDMFGVEDKDGNIDLFTGSGLQRRPTSLSNAHRYNLRNQTFGIPRATASSTSLKDPIREFRDRAGRFPSNSDSVNTYLYPDPTNENNRTLDRFFARDLQRNPLGSNKAPQGYFIIDALDRGGSRYTEYVANSNNYSQLQYGLNSTSLPADRTPGGPTVVGQYAGRAWFAGFSGEVIGGDELSPRLSSYVLFSQLVSNPSDIFRCHQDGDPTSTLIPDVIDTDGGFIRIDEANNINKLVNISDSLVILAENGIWRVAGTSENGFTATSFRVSKITEKGCINPSSVVEVDNTLFYWSSDGIYHIRTNEFGELVAAPVIVNRLQNFYNLLTEDDKLNAIGAYDRYQRKIRWVYDNNYNNSNNTKELVLDVTLGAFYLNEIPTIGDGAPRVLAVVEASDYVLNTAQEEVLVGSDPVVVGSDPVTVEVITRANVERGNLSYVALTGLDEGSFTFTFANYTDEEFVDWRSYDGVGVDAEAYVITNYFSGEDFQRGKKVTYLTVYMKKTEVGYETDENGNLIPINPASCIIQTMWDWTNSNMSGKWGRPFQAYRHRRLYLPSGEDDRYDDGNSVVFTRNKIRGGGKVLSMKFSSEPKKDLVLYGWSMIVQVNGNV